MNRNVHFVNNEFGYSDDLIIDVAGMDSTRFGDMEVRGVSKILKKYDLLDKYTVVSDVEYPDMRFFLVSGTHEMGSIVDVKNGNYLEVYDLNFDDSTTFYFHDSLPTGFVIELIDYLAEIATKVPNKDLNDDSSAKQNYIKTVVKGDMKISKSESPSFTEYIEFIETHH